MFLNAFHPSRDPSTGEWCHATFTRICVRLISCSGTQFTREHVSLCKQSSPPVGLLVPGFVVEQLPDSYQMLGAGAWIAHPARNLLLVHAFFNYKTESTASRVPALAQTCRFARLGVLCARYV